MKRGSRFGCVVRWGLTAATLLLLGVCLLSCSIQCVYVTDAKTHWCSVSGGSFGMIWHARGLHIAELRPGWELRFSSAEWNPFGFEAQLSRPTRWLLVPLWLPSLGLLIATVVAWRFASRGFPPGHCRRCGYDLTGNMSGRCPGCGEAVSSQRS